MALIKFTRNYRDDSTDRGFQFEFYCDRCGSDYQSTFRGSSTNALDDALGYEPAAPHKAHQPGRLSLVFDSYSA